MLLELIARFGSSQNKILLWHARLTMIIFYDLHYTEQLALPLECVLRALSGVRRQGEFVISYGFRTWGDDRAAQVRTDV